LEVLQVQLQGLHSLRRIIRIQMEVEKAIEVERRLRELRRNDVGGTYLPVI
jgi:hypothetical protein